MALDGLRLSVGTLTVIPAGPVGTIDRSTAARAMLLAPLSVLPLALGAGLVGWLAAVVSLPEIAVGLLVVAALALGTRGMHLDGLTDTVDGLGSGWNADRSLEVMRRGDLGPMGAAALAIVLGLQAATAGHLVRDWPSALLLVLAVCGSRAALAVVCVRGVPAAREQGLGATVAASVPLWAATATWVGVALAVLAAHLVAGGTVAGPLAGALLAPLAVIVLVRHCVRRLGGVTGDVMGASVEIALTVMLLGAATS